MNCVALFAFDDNGGVNKIHQTIIQNTAKLHSFNWTVFYMSNNILPLSLLKLLARVWSFKPQLIFVGNGREALISLILRSLTGCKAKIVYVQHTPLNLSKTSFVFSRFLIRFLAHRTSFVTISDELMEHLVNDISIPARLINKIYNPVVNSTECKTFLGARSLDKSTTIKFIAVGRLSYQKNFEFQLKFMRSLIDLGYQVNLDIYGDGELKNSLNTSIEDLALEKVVKLKGFSDNVKSAMRTSDIFLLTSRWEGLPTVLIEAVQNTPRILAYRCPTGITEILKDQSGIQIADELSLAVFVRQFETMLPITGTMSRDVSRYNIDTNVSDYVRCFNDK